MNNQKCLSCFNLSEKLVQLANNPLESIVSYVEYLEKLLEINDFRSDRHETCSVCKRELDYEEYFILGNKEKLFTEAISKMLGKEISRFMPYCSNCERNTRS